MKSSDAKNYPNSCKLFVGGLNGLTSKKDLIDYFSAYGHIVDSFIVYENSRPF